MDKRLINIAVVVAILVAVAIAITLALLLPRQKDSDSFRNSDSERFSATPTGDISLVGNFAILHKTASAVSDATICTYLTTILSSAQLNATKCTILEKSSSGSVKVRYKLAIGIVAGKDRQYVLKLASSSIAKSSSDVSAFTINQTSITFEDESGRKQGYCYSWSCADSNSLCVSVVGGYLCVCLTGSKYDSYTRLCSNGYVNRYCNSTKKWTLKAKICDKFQDCPDDSDEINCVCDFSYQYPCKNGRCISNKWLCDGVKDCPEGDDEMFPQCDECGKSQFRCEKPRNCIPLDQQCDGRLDCVDSSDEYRCINFDETELNNEAGTRLLTVTYKGTSEYKICSDNWNETWSSRVCSYLGFGAAATTSSELVNGSFLALNPRTSSSNFIDYFNTNICRSQLAVAVSCQPAECGIRTVSSESVGPYIINGQRAARGAWPWQVVVYTGVNRRYGGFEWLSFCGGILINDRWILTAAHCIRVEKEDESFLELGYTGTTRRENIQILMGTISLNSTSNTDMRKALVDGVFPHRAYNSITIANDVGLIRLSQPVSFSDTVRPICLPAFDEDLNRFRVCVDTGFGLTLRGTESADLLQTKMNILPNSKCSEYDPDFNRANHICLGTSPTVIDNNICLGDSGGPLSCQDQNGVWMAIGVNSYVLGKCRLTFVTRVPAYVGWIKATIAANDPSAY